MRKKEERVKLRVPAPKDGLQPNGKMLLRLAIEVSVYEDGSTMLGERVLDADPELTPGMLGLLTMAAVSINKDALIHRRWNTIDRQFAESLEARVKEAKAELDLAKKVKKARK